MQLDRREFIRNSATAAAVAAIPASVRAEPAADMKFIDIHCHCVEESGCPIGKGLPPLSNPQEMVRFYDELGVEKGCILPLGTCENFIGGQSNEEVLRIAKAHPDRFVPFCNIDPRAGGNSCQARFDEAFAWYREHGCKGIGEICSNIHFLDPRAQNLFAAAERAGLSVTFHIAAYEGWLYGLVDEPGLPELEECLKRFPKLKFFGHSQSFWCEIGEYTTLDERIGYPRGPVKEGAIPRLMRRYPNLYGDLSAGSGANALMRDREYGIRFLTEFQDRLMFGIDICAPQTHWVKLPQYLRELVAKGEISETVFRKVGRENAIKLCGL